ncbi:MAG TPA: DUF4384 domain-containing protein [Gemmatimonadales bacterium]|nr:DUF4384 domain-containing protein [Gemmatimonadales bacterium]
MILALTLALTVVAPGPRAVSMPRRSDTPPIKVWINPDHDLASGDRVRVGIHPAEDGYVVVLHADPSGRVRILFPLDPSMDNFVSGDKDLEIRGPGDREAFSIAGQSGQGVVLAAWSASQFSFDEYVKDDHWDFTALDNVQTGSDPEAALVNLVQVMAGDQQFEFDAFTYTVSQQTAYGAPQSDYPGYDALAPSVGWSVGFGYPYWGLGITYGYPYGYNPYWWGYPIISVGYPYWGGYWAYYHPHYWYPRYGSPWGGYAYRGYYGPAGRYPFGGGLLVDRVRTAGWSSGQPGLRVTSGTLYATRNREPSNLSTRVAAPANAGYSRSANGASVSGSRSYARPNVSYARPNAAYARPNIRPSDRSFGQGGGAGSAGLRRGGASYTPRSFSNYGGANRLSRGSGGWGGFSPNVPSRGGRVSSGSPSYRVGGFAQRSAGGFGGGSGSRGVSRGSFGGGFGSRAAVGSRGGGGGGGRGGRR